MMKTQFREAVVAAKKIQKYYDVPTTLVLVNKLWAVKIDACPYVPEIVDGVLVVR